MLKALKQALEDFKSALADGQQGTSRGDSELAPSADPTHSPQPEPATQGSPAPESSAEADALIAGTEAAAKPSQGYPSTVDVETGAPDSPHDRSAAGFGIKQALVAMVGAGWLVWQNLDRWLWPEPADKGVIATYADGTVTKEELLASLDSHPEAERRALATPEGLRHLIQDIAVHRVVERWAKERQLDEKSSVQHAMKHAAEEVNLHDITDQIHQGQIRVDEGEIQRYYEENREQLGNRPLAEVRDFIRETLHAGKEKEYVESYLRDLRARAGVTVDYQLLAVPEPTEEEMSSYYLSHQADFREPERLRIQEMRFGASSEDREKAERALARVQAGEDFDQVARELAEAANQPAQQVGSEYVVRGARGAEFDEKVFSLREGEVSQPFKEGDAYRLVKVLERQRERTRGLDEAREEIRRKVEAEKATRVYGENKAKTLFTLRGRRFTLGEFLEEYEQFPPDLRARYQDFEGKKVLVDRLVDRLLVLDTASGQMLDVKNKKEIEDARRHVLAQILHQEEMEGKLVASDDEVKRYYEQHRSHYVEPARVKISYIRVGMGGSEDSRKRARERIDEAARRLQAAKDRPEAFAEIAREFSEDPQTASKGGELDRWLAQQDDFLSHTLAHDFNEAVFRLKVGETSPVITMGDSYYIVRLRERQEPKALTLDQARTMAREDLLAEKHERALRDLEAELARRMRLVVYDGRLQALVAEIEQSAVSSQQSAISKQPSGTSDQQSEDHSSHR